jgi:integrase
MSTRFKTSKQIDTLPPGLHAYADGGNLCVKVSPNGIGRSFVFRYTSPTGKDRKMGLGGTSTKSIDEALALARKWQEVRNGTSPMIDEVCGYLEKKDPDAPAPSRAVLQDPIEVDRILQEKAENERVHNVTFKQIMDEYFKETIASCVRSTQEKFALYMEPIVTKIGRMRAASISREILLTTVGLNERYQSTPVSAATIHGHIKAAYELAKFNHGLKENPADFRHPRLRDYQSKPHDALPYTELGPFMLQLRDFKSGGYHEPSVHPTAALCLEWLILAGCRRDEACKMQWKDVEDWQSSNKPNWTIPPEKHKSGHRRSKEIGDPFDIPITAPMWEILRIMQQRYPKATRDDFVFQTPLKNRRGHAITGAAVGHQLEAILAEQLEAKLARGEEINKPTKCTVHGFRTTFAMWAESTGRYAQELIERQINHKIPGVAGQYRHQGRRLPDPMLEQRRVMMEAYAKFAGMPEYSDNVVKLERVRA